MRSIQRYSVTTWSVLFFLSLFTALSTGPVMAAQDALICPADRLNSNGNICEASDVQLAAAVVSVTQTGLTCTPGETISVAIAGTVNLRKGDRFDIGVWVSTDGKPMDLRGGTNGAPDEGGAQNCEVLPLPYQQISEDTNPSVFIIDSFDDGVGVPPGRQDCYDTSAASNGDISSAFLLTSERDSIINGLVDSNNDGAINTGPNGPDTTSTLKVFGVHVIAGALDMNDDGIIDATDTGTWNGYPVGGTSGGVVDADGDGAFGGAGDNSAQAYNDQIPMLCVKGPTGKLALETLVSWHVPSDAALVCDPTVPDSYTVVNSSKCSVNSSEVDVDIVGKLTIAKIATPADGSDFEFTYTNDSPPLADQDPNDAIPDISPASPFTLKNAGVDDIYAEIGTGPATIVITESDFPGWDLADLQCTGDDLTPVVIDVANKTATVTLEYNDVNPLASQSHVTCTFDNVKSNPEIQLLKTASPTTYSAVGQVINYSYLMTNTGNVDLYPTYAVTDDKVTVNCPSTPVTLAPTETVTCTANHTVTQADLDAGLIVNKATSTAQDAAQGGSPVTSNEDTETVTATANPALTLVKTAAPTTYDAVGDVINYSYVMTNDGNVTLFPAYAVTDDKVTVICPTIPATLAPLASVTCAATHTITQADLDAGSIVNKATGTAQDAAQGGSPVTSNEDIETVTSVIAHALTLDKTATPSIYSTVGEVINYSYVMTNNGNVTLFPTYAVADDKVTVTCPATPTTLVPSASVTCAASHTITQADLDAGSIVNKATGTAQDAAGSPVTSNEDIATVTAIATKALVLEKTAAPSTYSAVGDVIDYSYVMTNDGNVTLFPAYALADDKVTVTCPAIPATLAPSASVTCAATHTITQADLDAGSIVNKATGTAQDAAGSPVTSNEDIATVTAIATKALVLDKTATPSTYSAVGDVINYSYVMTNDGNVTLFPAYAVADDKVTVTCPAIPATLAPSASVTCKATHTITQADLDTGSIVNKATGTAQDAAQGGSSVTSNEDVETVTSVIAHALTLDKTATPATYNAVGDVIDYSYVMTNNGNVTLFPTYAVADDKVTVICPATPSTLVPSASVTCKATHTITQADLDAGSIVNKATGTAQDAAGSPVASNEDIATVTAIATKALVLDKTATPSTYSAVGDVIDYSYVMTNDGNVTLFPAYAVTDDKVTVICPATPSTLVPLASVTCAATHTITQADLDAGSIVNKATGTAQDAVQGGSSVTSNEDIATVTAIATKALVLDKTATPATYNAVGDVIDYSYVMTNNGNVTLFPTYAVADDKVTVICPATPSTLVPSASVTCKATHTITQADLDAGSIVNTATGTAQDAAGSPVASNEDIATVTAIATKALVLDKTATPATYNAVGDVINYSYVMTNDGNVTLFPTYAVTDDKVTVTCPATPATLAPSASVTCTATHTITQADLDAGSIVNKATGTAQDAAQGGSPVTSNEDTETVTATAGSTLTLVKAATPSTYSAVGDVINYSYVMTNNGNVTLFPTYAVADDKVTVTCPAIPATLAPSASVTCMATHTITQADLDAGSIVNKATGTAQDAAQGGSPVTSNEDTETVTATAGSTLTLVKAATPSTYSAVGDVIDYSYVMTNNGNVTLFPTYAVADDKVTVTCPAIPATLAPSASVTCTASHTITQADLDAGSIVNKATGTAQDAAQGGSPVTSNEDTETVTATAGSTLTLVKAATPSTYSAVGDVINYSYVMTNNGNVTLFPTYAVGDDKVTVICPAIPATLAPSASVTCTATHTITQADLDAGSIVNKATGTAQDAAQGGSPVTSNEDDATVTAEIVPPMMPAVPVPVNDKLALLLLTLMLLAAGWYFRPVIRRKS